MPWPFPRWRPWWKYSSWVEMIIYKTFINLFKDFFVLSLRLGMLVWSSQRTWSASWRDSNVVLLEIWRVLQSDLLQEAETTDEGLELKFEGKDPKCRKIFSNVSFAMRSSFRKCGFRRLVGLIHEGIREDFLKLWCLPWGLHFENVALGDLWDQFMMESRKIFSTVMFYRWLSL